ncbi:MAG TPA: ABC transporter permease [Puia sp.]|nr:ABC transporter permease [Puia sp.]
MLKNYFKTAWKNIFRNKVFAIINIGGLSVGIGCCMLILLYTADELSFDRFHKKADHIYRIVSMFTNSDGSIRRSGKTGMMPGPNFKEAIPEMEAYVRIQSGGLTVRHDGQVFEQENLFVDDNFFSVFTFPFTAGDPHSALVNSHSVVLCEEIAEKLFGKKNAIGQVLELKTRENFEPFIVSGVTKKSPQNSSIKIKMMVPLKSVMKTWNNKSWEHNFLNTFVILKAGANVKAVEDKCNFIYNTLDAEELKMNAETGRHTKTQYKLQPLPEMHLSTEFTPGQGLNQPGNPLNSYILSGIALFILLIACINFINLTVARSLKRAKEIGIRKVVGAQRWQLIVQFLGESYILSFIAFLLAFALVQILLPFFNSVVNKALSFDYLLDYKLVAVYISLFLITGLLAGFYPALVLSGFDPVQTLYGRQRFTGKNYLSKGLVILQFTLATFLTIATITINSQFNYLTHYNLGYNDKNVVKVYPGKIPKDKIDLLRNELGLDPSIKLVTADQADSWSMMAHVNNEQGIEFVIKHIDENYVPLFEIPIVSGRNFSQAHPSDSALFVLVNESFVREAGWKDPIGQTVDFFSLKRKYTVIGIVRDHHFQSLRQKIRPELFTMDPSYPFDNVYIKLRTGNTALAMNHIGKSFRILFPTQPYQYHFQDTENAAQYESESKTKQIINFSAILTIFISCIGLLGLATLSAERRTKEIGIRKVLGASVSTIVQKLSMDFLKLVILAALIASPMAWWALNKWMEDYPYHIPIGGWIFGFATVLIVLIALLTVGFQTFKAAVSNPVKSLRAE